jgi:hypothetical protein
MDLKNFENELKKKEKLYYAELGWRHPFGPLELFFAARPVFPARAPPLLSLGRRGRSPAGRPSSVSGAAKADAVPPSVLLTRRARSSAVVVFLESSPRRTRPPNPRVCRSPSSCLGVRVTQPLAYITKPSPPRSSFPVRTPSRSNSPASKP